MFPKVNKDLLPFKIIYFLKSGGASFMVFIPPIASQRGISSEGIGIIYTVNPLVSASFNVFVGYCSDKWKIHRLMLIITSLLVAISYTAYFFIPSVQLLLPANISVPSQYLCEENLTSITLCPDNKLHEDYTSENFIMCNAIHEDLGERISSDQCQFECKAFLSNESCDIDKTLNMTTRGNMILEKRYICQEKECFRNKTDDISNFKCSGDQITCKEAKLFLNCQGECHNQQNEESISFLLSSREFLISALCIITLFMTLESSNSLTDAMCFMALGENSHRYGNTRLFGTLAWGLVGGAMGLLVNIASKGHQMNYTPAMVISSFFLFFNVVFTSRINVDVPGKQENSSIRNVLLSFRCIFLLATVFIMGVSMGMVWTFEFIYIKDIAFQWDKDFSNLNLLFGLIVITDCILGETPSLMLSGFIIKKLTNVHTFSLTLAVTSIRLLLYGIVSNPWMFLPVHLTHGISVGVFFANMITYSYILAPEGAQDTMQSVSSGCFTIGKASGALLGGVLIQGVGGSLTFIIMGCILSFYTVLYTIINSTVQKCNAISSEDDNAFGVSDDPLKSPNATEKGTHEKLPIANASEQELDIAAEVRFQEML